MAPISPSVNLLFVFFIISRGWNPEIFISNPLGWLLKWSWSESLVVSTHVKGLDLWMWEHSGVAYSLFLLPLILLGMSFHYQERFLGFGDRLRRRRGQKTTGCRLGLGTVLMGGPSWRLLELFFPGVWKREEMGAAVCEETWQEGRGEFRECRLSHRSPSRVYVLWMKEYM